MLVLSRLTIRLIEVAIRDPEYLKTLEAYGLIITIPSLIRGVVVASVFGGWDLGGVQPIIFDHLIASLQHSQPSAICCLSFRISSMVSIATGSGESFIIRGSDLL